MTKVNPVIHGPFQDDINYTDVFKINSQQGITRIPFPKSDGKLKGPQKVKKRKNK